MERKGNVVASVAGTPVGSIRSAHSLLPSLLLVFLAMVVVIAAELQSPLGDTTTTSRTVRKILLCCTNTGLQRAKSSRELFVIFSTVSRPNSLLSPNYFRIVSKACFFLSKKKIRMDNGFRIFLTSAIQLCVLQYNAVHGKLSCFEQSPAVAYRLHCIHLLC